ncbi:hypothetical protein U27_04926 [Candidatus Vecturithrix granuli]|uniref:Uncharacterized protein n=1 Tax=Vecturithrix granuli TaxID=1499967 RepID=A0A081C049_VECG1|nr:hypothetical protein U27_04926 [Candidatus Vecturithrix granuli]
MIKSSSKKINIFGRSEPVYMVDQQQQRAFQDQILHIRRHGHTIQKPFLKKLQQHGIYIASALFGDLLEVILN